MEDGLRTGFQRQRRHCLRYPVAHGGHAENARASRGLGYLHGPTGGGEYVPDDIRFQIL